MVKSTRCPRQRPGGNVLAADVKMNHVELARRPQRLRDGGVGVVFVIRHRAVRHAVEHVLVADRRAAGGWSCESPVPKSVTS